MVDQHRAVFFGGWQPGPGRVNDPYLFDFRTMVSWTTTLNESTAGADASVEVLKLYDMKLHTVQLQINPTRSL